MQLYVVLSLYAFNIDEQIVNNGITYAASIVAHTYVVLLHDVNFNNIFPTYNYVVGYTVVTYEMNITEMRIIIRP